MDKVNFQVLFIVLLFLIIPRTVNAEQQILIKGSQDNTGKNTVNLEEEGDILISGEVQIKELKFSKVGNTTVKFNGNSTRKLIDKTIRVNLPEKIEPNVIYQNIKINFQILSLFVNTNDIDKNKK